MTGVVCAAARLLCVSFLILVLSFSSAVAAAVSVPSNYFSRAEAEALLKFLQTAQQSAASQKELFFASQALGILAADKTQESSLCSRVALPSKVTLEALFHHAQLNELLGCKRALTQEQQSLVYSVFSENTSASVRDLYYALSLAAFFKASGQGASQPSLAPVLNRLADLVSDQGLFKNSDKAAPSFLATGVAYSSVAIASQQLGAAAVPQKLLQAVGKASTIFDSGVQYDEVMIFEEEKEKSIKVTGSLLHGLHSALSALRNTSVSLTPESVLKVAEYVVQSRFPRTAEDAYHFLLAVSALSNSAVIPKPIVLSCSKNTFSLADADKTFKVEVTDLLGAPVNEASVTLTKAALSSRPSAAVLKDQVLQAAEKPNTFTVSFASAKIEAGFYNLDFQVSVTSAYLAPATISRKAKMVSVIEVVGLEVRPARQTANEPLKLDAKNSITVSFQVMDQTTSKPVQVHQAVVQLRTKSGRQTDTLAIYADRQYKADLSYDEVSEALGGIGGECSLVLVLSGPLVKNPLERVLARVVLPAPQSSDSSERRVPFYSSLTEIKHIFRSPEGRPPVAISYAATLAVLAPLLLLFVGLPSVRGKFSFPGGKNALPALGFQLCIGAILGLFVVYWLYLNMFQTLGYLALISVPTTFLGRQTLRSLGTRA